jgi:hypothetical protein
MGSTVRLASAAVSPFWIYMQIGIVVCVVAAMVIAIVKLA